MSNIARIHDESVVKVKHSVNITHNDEESLLHVVTSKGPVDIHVTSKFCFYSSGVYSSDTCSTQFINHAVLIIGYGVTPLGQQYWIVKNSWSNVFGMNGYFWIEHGKVSKCYY
jgi:C1A family cysteine protease